MQRTFIEAPRPSPLSLVRAVAAQGFGGLWSIRPFETMWDALGRHFHDPRLRQLFGRYATYCGASPFLAPATLMLVAHVEQEGVWLVAGGMHRVAAALAALATAQGAMIRYGAAVDQVLTAGGRVSGVRLAGGEQLAANAVVVNADAAAVAGGMLGPAVARAVPKPAGSPLALGRDLGDAGGGRGLAAIPATPCASPATTARSSTPSPAGLCRASRPYTFARRTAMISVPRPPVRNGCSAW